MDIAARIKRLEDYRYRLVAYQDGKRDDDARRYLNCNLNAVRREVIEAGCMTTVTLAPPPAIGGPIMRNIDPFGTMFSPPYGLNVIGVVIDMLDQAVGILNDPDYEKQGAEKKQITHDVIKKGFVFIAMPMSENVPDYDDVVDGIKAAAQNCGFIAERVDDEQSNDRITDRLIESIRRAEYVVADLTAARPNVFYEAGFAAGLGKNPIYIAKKGTDLHFDLKDYPVIFFENIRSLRTQLEKRLQGLAAKIAQTQK